ncbi:MAG: alpha/beta fold hydrolase [Boseongicola sp.]|nr:alpha/beta fold hydrolase [Boseongicola sp.]
MTPLVLIPGFMCDDRLFGPQIAELKRDREVFPVIPVEPSIKDMATAILDEINGTFCVAGLSMGGIVALEILRQAPDRIERLALMDTTPLADAPENYDIRTRQISDVWEGRLTDVMREELKPAYLVDGPHKSELLDLCADMAHALGPYVFEAQAIALRDRDDLTPFLEMAPEHTMLLYGAEDRLCPPDRHIMMHKAIPNSQLVEIEGAGHLPTLEKPFETTSALTSWLAN